MENKCLICNVPYYSTAEGKLFHRYYRSRRVVADHKVITFNMYLEEVERAYFI